MSSRYQSPKFLVPSIVVLIFFAATTLGLVLPFFQTLPIFLRIGLYFVVIIILLCPSMVYLLSAASKEKRQIMQSRQSLSARESKLKEILLRLPAIMWTTNRDLEFTFLMGEGYKVFEIDANQLLGKTLYQYFGVDNPEFYPIKMHRCALEGNSVRYEFEWKGRLFDTTLAPLHNGEGETVGVIGIAVDVTDRRKSELKLREVGLRMARVAEEERRRLSRELHDGVGQNLSAININLNAIRARLCGSCKDDLETMLQDTMDLVEEVGIGVRDVMSDLRPRVLDDYGLLAALRWYGERFSMRFGLDVEVLGGSGIGRLDPDTETALFRISQEAMMNILKHAEADKIKIKINLDTERGAIRLVIMDNGKGFVRGVVEGQETGKGLGLICMEERAQSVGGRVEIKSSPGKGTRVIVEIPH